MYLVDTNVWLERLLDQAKSEEVGQFIDDIPSDKLTKYLKPQIVTIYTGQPLGTLLLKEKIKKDPNGDIEILKHFGDSNTTGNILT